MPKKFLAFGGLNRDVSRCPGRHASRNAAYTNNDAPTSPASSPHVASLKSSASGSST
jgi:hypothetical protein